MVQNKVLNRVMEALSRAGRDPERALRAIAETREWALGQAGQEDWSPELRLHLDEEFRRVLSEVERAAAGLEEFEWAGAALEIRKWPEPEC